MLLRFAAAVGIHVGNRTMCRLRTCQGGVLIAGRIGHAAAGAGLLRLHTRRRTVHVHARTLHAGGGAVLLRGLHGGAGDGVGAESGVRVAVAGHRAAAGCSSSAPLLAAHGASRLRLLLHAAPGSERGGPHAVLSEPHLVGLRLLLRLHAHGAVLQVLLLAGLAQQRRAHHAASPSAQAGGGAVVGWVLKLLLLRVLVKGVLAVLLLAPHVVVLLLHVRRAVGGVLLSGRIAAQDALVLDL